MPKRILIVKLSSMGDVIHALPVPVTLRASFPDARLAWLVERRWLPLVQHHPQLDEVFTIDTFAMRQEVRNFPAFLQSIAAFRKFRADACVDLQGSIKSSLLARLSGAALRVGFSRAVVREPLAGFFYTRRVHPRSPHIVDQMLDVLDGLGAIRREVTFPFPIPESARDAAQAWLLQNRVGPFAFFSPGGGWASKRWPSERYAELAQRLEQQYGLAAVLNLGPGDRDINDTFRRAKTIRARLFSGGIFDLAAMLANAELVVGGDTGPLHLAAALGLPVVALFGPTDPARNGPYSKCAVVLRKSLELPALAAEEHGARAGKYQRSHRYSPAMLAITIDDVAEACGRLLQLRTGTDR